STTRTLRKVVMKPRDRAVPAVSLGARRARLRGAATAAPLASDASDLLLDPCHHARLRVEEALLHLVPTSEPELVDRELAWADRELLPVLLEHARDNRAVPPVGPHLLGGRRAEEAQELVRLVLRLTRLRDGDRVLDQDRLLRDHVLDVL